MTNFGLKRLTIYAYKDEKRSAPAADKCEVMFNPETYSLTYGNEFKTIKSINKPGSVKYHTGSAPDGLKLVLVFTNTGTEQLGVMKLLRPRKSVVEKVRDFLNITTVPNITISAADTNDLHRPYYLRIEWGVLVFDCDLESVKVKFTMFDRRGNPLRAELSTAFKGELNESSKLLANKLKSPDVSHARSLNQCENLPILCYDVYKNSSYYMQVADFNGLNSVRGLDTGSLIRLPAIK